MVFSVNTRRGFGDPLRKTSDCSSTCETTEKKSIFTYLVFSISFFPFFVKLINKH